MLRNRQEQEEQFIRGVNLKIDPTKLKFGSFALLQNWIPTKIFSVKKKRGVVVFTSTVVVPVVPGACT